jgi:hypothetical protein
MFKKDSIQASYYRISNKRMECKLFRNSKYYHIHNNVIFTTYRKNANYKKKRFYGHYFYAYNIIINLYWKHSMAEVSDLRILCFRNLSRECVVKHLVYIVVK